MPFRKVIFWAHLITGLVVGTVVFTMAVTGALLAFEPQIVEFSERHVRHVRVPETGARLKLSEIVARAQAHKPEMPVGMIMMDSRPDRSVTVNFGREGGTVFVDPYTGKILGGLSKAHDAMHFVLDIHRWLGVRDKGKVVTHTCNAAFFFMVLSGLYIWWPRNWHPESLKRALFFQKIPPGRQRDWNWHNVIGIWCLPLLLVTTLTGLVMSYAWANDLLFRAAGSPPPSRMQAGGAKPGVPVGTEKPAPFILSAETVDALGANAEKQVPGWQTITFRLPKSQQEPVSAFVIEPGAPEFFRSQMTLDAKTGTVVKWEPFRGQPRGKRFRSWVVPLHTGEAWGIPGQILAGLAALGATLLIWTGFSLAWRRFFGRKPVLPVRSL